MTTKTKQNFVFRKHMSIGDAEAERDNQYLKECFIDIGDYGILIDTSKPQSIVLGRTGVGKSALLEQIEEKAERVIRIEPEELALRHVSNSTILKFFEELGVNLDIFYSLLWQHTLAVELIKHVYNIDSIEAKNNFMRSITNIISGDQKKKQALNYIEEWGDRFWLDTESRIKEFTDKLESSLKASIETKGIGIKYASQAASTLSEETKSEVIHYGKKVVNEVQIEKLAKIVNLLAENICKNPQKKIYILVDRLDDNWVEDSLRYKLIRALIETIKKFRKIPSVKVIITLRTDLLDRVLDKTRDSGFQREKYESLFLDISWTKEQLLELLNKRINLLLKHQYTKNEVLFTDIFQSKIDKHSSIDYILDRTFLRPRDAIMFVNECIKKAQGKTEISSAIIKQAEKQYSQTRVESLEYEWYVEHPMLTNYIGLLHSKKKSFRANTITNDELESLIEVLVEPPSQDGDAAIKIAHHYLNSKYPESDKFLNQLRQSLLYILYKVGVVGIKVDGTSSVSWINNREQGLSSKKIQQTSIIYIHNALWRALAIDKRA